MAGEGDITVLLRQWQAGSPRAESELFSLVMPDLRRLAHHLMQGERKGVSLEATELVDQIYLRLVHAKNRDWQNRRHFFAIAARAMRHHLIDRARARPKGEAVALEHVENVLAAASRKLDQAIGVDRALNRLAAFNPEAATVVEVKYFLGLTDDEAAQALGIKLRTLQRMWLEARKWLYEHLEDDHAAAQHAGR